jgi:hypothetical protein
MMYASDAQWLRAVLASLTVLPPLCVLNQINQLHGHVTHPVLKDILQDCLLAYLALVCMLPEHKVANFNFKRLQGASR